MEKLLKYIFYTISIIIFILILLFFFINNTLQSKSKNLEPFVRDSVQKISTWDINNFYVLLDKEVYKNEKDKNLNLFIKKLSTLGKFKYIQKINLKSTTTVNEVVGFKGNRTISTFIIHTKYKNDEAYITLRLIERENDVKINHIHFGSNILMK